jgi:ferritin-like metal-binding protein YciE
MKLSNLSDLYLRDLRTIYDAEQQLLRALTKMADAAANDELEIALRTHVDVTRNQVERLESIFHSLGQSPLGEACEAMEGLIAEADELLAADADDEVLDAGLITAAQKVEHYEIAAYGSLRTYARLLRRYDDAALLQESLEEEKQADERLTRIAEGFVNTRALT